MSHEEEHLNPPSPIDPGMYAEEWIRPPGDTLSLEAGKILMDSTMHERGDIALRRSKDPDAVPIVMYREEFQAFVAALKRGDYDELSDGLGGQPD